jgi:hypothetical protein
MKQVTVNIPDHQFGFFMNLIQNLDFVQIAEPSQFEKSLSEEQREIWENIKSGFYELKMMEKGELRSRPVDELLKELSAPV